MKSNNDRPAVTHSPTSNLSFTSIEQLDEVTHAMGWPTEYRQLEPGPLSSTFTLLEDGSWFLMEEQSSRHLEVQAPAPAGKYVLALVEGDPAVVNGQTLSSNHVFVQHPDSDFRVTLPAGIRATQIGIEAEQFEEVILAVAPDLSVPHTSANVIATAPGMLASVRKAMRAALLAPSSREASRDEVVSRILADIVSVVADHGQAPFGRGLHRATAQRTLDRAREYIEAHLAERISVVSMSRYAGTTRRSLERIFARELGMSPSQYIKARRLNAVHRCLLSADREQCLTITEVALSHGFGHMGRFAGDYRRYFGECPRETLVSR